MKRRKTVHYTLRVNDDIFSVVEKEAQRKGISTSSLINQILTKYANRERHLEHLGFIPVSKDTLRKMLNRVDTKLLAEDSKELGSTVAREYVSYIFHDVNKHTLIQFLDVWCSVFESYKHETNGYAHRFSIKHDIGIQYSLHMAEYLKALIEPIITRRVSFETTPNMVNFMFEV